MAHEKVYGICENKCKVEVIPKSNLLLLTGSISSVSNNADGNKTFSDLDYNNYHVVSVKYRLGSGNWIAPQAYAVGWGSVYNTGHPVIKSNGNLSVSFHNNSGSNCTIYYEILLMKVK